MNDPLRWREAPDAPLGARELLAAATRSSPMPGEARSRVARKLAADVDSAAMHLPLRGLFANGWGRFAFAAALVVVSATVAASVHRRIVDARVPSLVLAPPIVKSLAPEAPSVPAPAPIEIAVPAPEPEPAIVPRKVAKAIAKEPPPPALEAPIAPPPPHAQSTLAAELRGLEDARRAMKSDPARALRLLEEDASIFGAQGTLGDERALLRLEALHRLGKDDEARAQANAWLARAPGGLYADRLRAILLTR